MLNILKEIKKILESQIFSIIENIEINSLIRRINDSSIETEEISNILSKYDKNFRKELIASFKFEDDLIYNELNRANNNLENRLISDFITSVKTGTYKEYVKKLSLTELEDLKELLTHASKTVRLYDETKYNEYLKYIELLIEAISLNLKTEIVDLLAINNLFKTISIEEIARYIKTYPEIFLFYEPNDLEVRNKMELALDLIASKTLLIEPFKTDMLIYKKRKYF